MSCFLMRAVASIGLTPISAYILRPPCAAITLTSVCVSALTSPKAPMTIPRIGLTVLSLASIGELGLDRADAGVRHLPARTAKDRDGQRSSRGEACMIVTMVYHIEKASICCI
ncbi:hypothetical protein T492DRAFT_115678 [Pavlovales sp. CCMP2436]|nr:hypothetical protein T492DRAFT_115678 [Pavlovales sp. CCMP2436]